MSRTIKKFCFQMKLTSDAISQPAFTDRGVAFDLSHHVMVTRWSRSTSNFYALIGQNLKG